MYGALLLLLLSVTSIPSRPSIAVVLVTRRTAGRTKRHLPFFFRPHVAWMGLQQTKMGQLHQTYDNTRACSTSTTHSTTQHSTHHK